MHERLREQPEPSLLTQTVDRAPQEPRPECEIPRLLGRDPDVDGRERIGHVVQPDLRDAQQDRASSRLRIRERHDGQQAWVVVRESHLQCCVDDVVSGPRLTPCPPAAMRDRHQRAERRVDVARGASATGDGDERLRGTALKPHIPADHLLQPHRSGCLKFADFERLGMLQQPSDHLDGAKLIRGISSHH